MIGKGRKIGKKGRIKGIRTRKKKVESDKLKRRKTKR